MPYLLLWIQLHFTNDSHFRAQKLYCKSSFILRIYLAVKRCQNAQTDQGADKVTYWAVLVQLKGSKPLHNEVNSVLSIRESYSMGEKRHKCFRPPKHPNTPFRSAWPKKGTFFTTSLMLIPLQKFTTWNIVDLLRILVLPEIVQGQLNVEESNDGVVMKRCYSRYC